MLFFNQLGEILTSEMLSLILICIVFLGCLYQLYSRRINFSGIIALFALLFLFLGFIIQGSFTLITLMLFSLCVRLVAFVDCVAVLGCA
ncbi:serine protease, partial [Staphylococcus pseudintermedius]|nr:serine protease [Staphylococcus pseudintermedius]